MQPDLTISPNIWLALFAGDLYVRLPLPFGRLARALLGSLVSCLRGALGAVWDGLESNGVEEYGLGSCDAPRGAGKMERIS